MVLLLDLYLLFLYNKYIFLCVIKQLYILFGVYFQFILKNRFFISH